MQRRDAIREASPVEAPPQPVFWHCLCGVLLMNRIWHNAITAKAGYWDTQQPPVWHPPVEADEAHWEICNPPRTPLCGDEHHCQQKKETFR